MCDNNTWVSFIYSFEAIGRQDAGVCEAICLIRTDCHFVVAGIVECYFGNYQPPQVISGLTGTMNFTAYVNNGKVLV
jgi:hypothetical protein